MAVGRYRLAILISGRGSNMQALLESCAQGDFPAQVAVVISNCADAQGLEKACAAGIPALIVDHKAYAGKAAFENALHEALLPYAPDIICLAGFMRILSADFIARWPGRIINIHPSLLPAYKGLDTHARALADGAAQTGCTVHYVVPEMDSGPVIVRRAIDIQPGDTPETLALRVLAQEHVAYPAAVKIVCESLQGGVLTAAPECAEMRLGYDSTGKAIPMGQQPANTSVDPQALESARGMWVGFTTFAKYGCVAVAAVLLGMLVFVY